MTQDDAKWGPLQTHRHTLKGTSHCDLSAQTQRHTLAEEATRIHNDHEMLMDMGTQCTRKITIQEQSGNTIRLLCPKEAANSQRGQT